MIYVLFALEGLVAFFLLVKSNALSGRPVLYAGLGILVAFLVRLFLLDYVSQDYLQFLRYWIDYFQQNGGLSALGNPVGNYNIPYLTFLSLLSYMESADSLYLIKLFSIAFDIFLAYASMRLVRLFESDKKLLSAVYISVLILPTVLINSSVWGQCDSIYVSFGILGLGLALDEKPWGSVICAGIAFAFKLQAIFLLPVYAVLLFRGKLKWYHLLAFPLTYFVLMIPGILAGMSISDALLLYTTQTDSVGTGYSYNAPSLLSIVDAGRTALAVLNTASAVPIVSKVAVAVAFIAVLAVLIFSFVRRNELTDFDTLVISALFCVMIPFLLPRMHERYFYSADLLCLMLVFIGRAKPKYLITGILMELSSLWSYYCYYQYIMTGIIHPTYLAAFSVFIVLCLLIHSLCFPESFPSLQEEGSSK